MARRTVAPEPEAVEPEAEEDSGLHAVVVFGPHELERKDFVTLANEFFDTVDPAGEGDFTIVLPFSPGFTNAVSAHALAYAADAGMETVAVIEPGGPQTSQAAKAGTKVEVETLLGDLLTWLEDTFAEVTVLFAAGDGSDSDSDDLVFSVMDGGYRALDLNNGLQELESVPPDVAPEEDAEEAAEEAAEKVVGEVEVAPVPTPVRRGRWTVAAEDLAPKPEPEPEEAADDEGPLVVDGVDVNAIKPTKVVRGDPPTTTLEEYRELPVRAKRSFVLAHGFDSAVTSTLNDEQLTALVFGAEALEQPAEQPAERAPARRGRASARTTEIADEAQIAARPSRKAAEPVRDELPGGAAVAEAQTVGVPTSDEPLDDAEITALLAAKAANLTGAQLVTLIVHGLIVELGAMGETVPKEHEIRRLIPGRRSGRPRKS